MRSIGIIGLGNFGRFMCAQLAPHIHTVGCDAPGVRIGVSLATVCGRDIVVFAVPLEALGD